MALVTDIIARQAFFYPAIVDGQEATENRKEFDMLIGLGILERASTQTHRTCPTCGEETLEVQTISETRAYTLCGRDDSAGRDYFNPEELKQWRLNTPRLLSLFQKAIGIKSPQATESLEEVLWDLGRQEINGASYHIFFCRNINELENPKLSIITDLPYSVVFYTGTPKIALPDKVLLVPMASLIQKPTATGLIIDKEAVEQFFPYNTYPAKEGAIELDDGVALQPQDNLFLFEPMRNGLFKKQSKPLRPMATRIIQHLYGIRKYTEHSKTLDELASALDSTKVSISNEIKRIEAICADSHLPAILRKDAWEKWGINTDLKCCKR